MYLTIAAYYACHKCRSTYVVWNVGGDTFLRNVVLTRATRRNIPEDGILHSHRPENLKSYIAVTG
jgi:hypothetical protein